MVRHVQLRVVESYKQQHLFTINTYCTHIDHLYFRYFLCINANRNNYENICTADMSM